jgi:hypothetical protein
VGSRFIIISGNLTYRTVQDFLSEFYHPNHNRGFASLPNQQGKKDTKGLFVWALLHLDR